jgi:diguanylate cyclase (GGDEF)-like protein
MALGTNNHKGISLRTINISLIIGAVLVSALMFVSTFRLSSSFRRVTETSEQQIELRKAARELMDASDYLTEKVQRFTVTADMRFVQEYFDEAFIAHHREEAISRMSTGTASEEALKVLKDAMKESLALMNTEYYAMKLVIEAKGYTEYPELLQSIELSDSDKALSPQEKMRLATEMVLNDEYYNHKYLIRENMTISLDELEKMAYDKDEDAMAALSNELKLVRVVIILQTFGIVILVWLTTKLGIHPVLNAVDRIKEDSPIPEGGAVEFRYLAKAYNKMYEVYRKSLESLSFRASHDELSGLYNRAGYDLLLSSIDIESTYMLLFDVDNFKTINDTYGHGAGDEAIRNVARVLKENFRSDDYVCRIGGDEFVVLMVHAPKSAKNLISAKIKHINDELGNSRDNLPSYSVSVGIAHGSDSTDAINLFAKCDTALYESKARGKHTYTFADI